MPPVAADAHASPHRTLRVLAVLATGLALAIAWWIERGRPVALAEPGPQARVPCVSYAPFRRRGATPFDPAAQVSAQAIEQDLRLLRTRTDCVRTYAVSQGLDVVPAIARRLGMRVKLGAWLGRDDRVNAAELDRALALTREYRDVIDLLIVGNEVLLRGELPPDRLAMWLDRARRESAVPVSYADVWAFWLRHATALRAHVDVVTVHILPYWEDEPVAVERAVDHVVAIASDVARRFEGVPTWIGETGWPAAGRQRQGAVPGRLEQARFVRELVSRAGREQSDYNLIEGFDQPWKRALEGAMGGAWGLFDSRGVPHFAWSGPIERDAEASRGLVAAATGGAVGLAVGVARWRALLAALALGLACATIATIGVAHWQSMVAWNSTPADWLLSAAATSAALACALLAAGRIATLLASRAPAAALPGIARSLRGPPIAGRALGICRAALLFVVAMLALQLVFDGRYRDFALPLLAAPALLLLALQLAGDRLERGAREERLLALVMAACAPVIVWNEGLHNTQAIAFAALLLVLAAMSYATLRRTSTSAASSAADAASPAE